MHTPTRTGRGVARVRPPAVAGRFYPANHPALRSLVAELFAAAAHGARRLPAGSPRQDEPLGLLVPHAGLVYSGVPAAAGWSQLAPSGASTGRPARTVVLLGTNHVAAWLDGIGAWDAGAWATPVGRIAVDKRLAGKILALGSPFLVDLAAHADEHSLEVQLPLLLAADPGAHIVPLAVAAGTGDAAIDAGRRLGALLADHRAAGNEVVLAISSDMAHYPPDGACREAMARLLPAILGLDSRDLAQLEAEQRRSRMPGLDCGMCGVEPAVLGLAALRAMGATRGTTLALATSKDAGAPPDRTVGYLTVRFDP